MPRSTPSRALFGLALLLGAFWPGVVSADEADPAPLLRDRARKAEERGAWLEACRVYEAIARKGDDKERLSARDGYARCVRRLHLAARHADPLYRQAVAKLDSGHAIKAYVQVAQTLLGAYPDRGRADLAFLFQQGLHEVKLALDDPAFRRLYLPGAKAESVKAFKDFLDAWPSPRFADLKDAAEQLTELRSQARQLVGLTARLGLTPAEGRALGNVLVMELAAGACNGLDEYSSFLGPALLAQSQAPRVRTPGVGIDLTAGPKGVEVGRVWRNSPADKVFQERDVIVAVNGKPVEKLRPHEVEARLRGKAGDSVEIEFERDRVKQSVELKFRPFNAVAVEWEILSVSEPAVGYLRINYFAEDAARDVKEALGAMSAQASIKGLVLDLRGNPGGVYAAAVQVAELFLTEGIISVGQSPHPSFNRTFRVETPGPVQVPLVVLIDSETASAAEVLASALQESRPAATTVLMGQKTFGKGSVQCLIEFRDTRTFLDRTSGVRLTVARLYSPSNVPISGRGVTPDRPLSPGVDVKAAAREYLAGQLDKMMEMPRMLMQPFGDLAGDTAAR